MSYHGAQPDESLACIASRCASASGSAGDSAPSSHASFLSVPPPSHAAPFPPPSPPPAGRPPRSGALVMRTPKESVGRESEPRCTTTRRIGHAVEESTGSGLSYSVDRTLGGVGP